MTKLDSKVLSDESFGLKEYFKTLNLVDARLRFRIRSSMVPTVKMNFPNDPSFKGDLWTCQHCPRIDTQTHIRNNDVPRI